MASIQKKNNKYCVVYYCKDTDGKRKQKWETYDTKNAAKIRKAEIELKEKKGGIIVSNCKTLEDLINEYVELYQEHVPNCMRPLINKKLKLMSELTEHTLANEIEAPHEILRK